MITPVSTPPEGSRPILAILRGLAPDRALEVGATLLEAGITRMEVPLNSPDALDSIALLSEGFGQSALVGAGTVLSADAVWLVAKAGGRLIVAPNTHAGTIAAARDAGMEVWPGVFTPTEAFAALRAGATGLKLFPSEVAGPAGLAALKQVLPEEVPVFAVGGVTAENMQAWLSAGADGFGIGSALFAPERRTRDVARRAAALVAAFDAASAAPATP